MAVTSIGGTNMSSGGGSSTTTTETGPPQFQLDLNQEALEGLSPGDFQISSEFTQDEFDAFDLLRQFSAGGATDISGAATGTLTDFLSPEFLDVSNDPTTQRLADAIGGQFVTRFTESILPSLRGDATIAGQGAGSTKASQAEGLAAGRTASAASNSIAQLLSNVSGQRLQAQTAALGLAPDIAQLGLLPSNILADIGGQERELNLFNDAAGVAALTEYLRSIGIDLGGQGTSETTADQSAIDKLLSI